MTASRSRLVGLGVLAAGVAVVLARTLFAPGLGKPRPYTFVGEPVDLSNWQFQASQPLDLAAKENGYFYPALQAAQSFLYQPIGLDAGSRQLEIEMYYLVLTDSQIRRYLRDYHPEDIRKKEDVPELVQQQTSVGTHVQFQHGDRAYLSSCINPNGPSTVDKLQFDANRNTYDLQFGRALPVLLGREPIRDRRCLWTLMSLPAGDAAEAAASFAALEQIWPTWYVWWRDRFPAS